MEYRIDGWNNLCNVFELPDEFSNEFCHNGGHPTNFLLIDWFYLTNMDIAACSKEIFKKEFGEIEVREFSREGIEKMLIPFLIRKNYVKQDKKYLIICDFGAVFMFDKNGLINS